MFNQTKAKKPYSKELLPLTLSYMCFVVTVFTVSFYEKRGDKLNYLKVFITLGERFLNQYSLKQF